MKDNLYTLLYAVLLGVVCALLLAGTGEFTEPYRKANAKADKIRNILNVLGVSGDPGASAKELLATFEKEVGEVEQDSMTLYRLKDSGAVAVPFSGAGLWGPIKGFLALETDRVGIRGITFYEQEETPGLGGEIAAEWFTNQFEGKKIVSEAGTPGLEIVARKPGAQNEVHAISGATMTSKRVESMINKTVNKLVKRGE